MLIRSHRLLKGTLHERASVLTVDAMTCDSHQVAAARHGVAKQSQVTVVDVRAVKGDDMVQLPLQSLSHRLDSQDLKDRRRYTINIKNLPQSLILSLFFNYREDLHNVIGGGPDGVYILLTEDPHQAYTVRLKDPLLQSLELTILCDDDLFLIVSLG